MPAWLIPAIGAAASAIGAISSSRSQKKAANAQQGIAKTQQNLFQQTIPHYQQLLQQVQNYAGQVGQNPNQQTPQQQLQLSLSNQNIGQNLNRSLDQFGFQMGRRGLTDSSLDVAGRAAILANAGQQRTNVYQQNLMQQPMEYERRLGLLGNLLNPGLGMGQAAGSTFGQQANMYGQQAGMAGQNIGQSIQNFMMYDALRRANQDAAGSNAGGIRVWGVGSGQPGGSGTVQPGYIPW